VRDAVDQAAAPPGGERRSKCLGRRVRRSLLPGLLPAATVTPGSVTNREGISRNPETRCTAVDYRIATFCDRARPAPLPPARLARPPVGARPGRRHPATGGDRSHHARPPNQARTTGCAPTTGQRLSAPRAVGGTR
jgi:hypothetical protein